MQNVIQQFEAVRRKARSLLLAQVILRWLAIVLATVLACGLADYLLRLPGWIRLIIALSLAAAALFLLFRSVTDALKFQPGVGMMALRAEHLYPQLSGSLASGVEFASEPEAYADAPRSAALARAAIEDVGRKLEGVSVSRLINPRKTLKISAWAAAALLLFVGTAIATPDNTWLALQRWAAPLGQAQWPRRTSVVSLMNEKVWPTDTPLRLAARVDRGYHAGMRTWVIYRQIGVGGADSDQWMLMNEQGAAVVTDAATTQPAVVRSKAAGEFERLIDLPPTATHAGPPKIEFYFQAGDDQTPRQEITLIDRPVVTGVKLKTEPPAYASGLVAPQNISLEEQSGPVSATSAPEGSKVTMRFEFSQPLAAAPTINDWAKVLPGLSDVAGIHFVEAYPSQDAKSHEGYAIEARFVLHKTVQTPIHVTDAHGLSNLSERAYRVEAIADQPPAVSITQPTADEGVLVTAVLPVEALAQDDMAIESVALEAQKSPKPAAETVVTEPVVKLKQATGRANRMSVAQDLVIADLKTQPGEEVLLTAVAQDVFELDGERHAPVRSTPRRLRIVDATTFLSQIRAELGGVRQQAVRIDEQQRDLLNAPLDKALTGQQEINQRLEAQSSVLRNVKERLLRNHMEDPQINQTTQRAAELLDQASNASRESREKLDQAKADKAQQKNLRADARKDQEAVGKALTDLVALLDQGRDTVALQMQLQQMIAAQDALAADTRAALPRTLGKSPEQLTPQERGALDKIAEKQTALSAKADALSKQMHSTADELSRQNKDPQDAAAAQALAEAAAIAERQGLQQAMQQAADAAKENRLSESGQSQQASIDTMKKMMEQLGNQDARQQEVLRRKLEALAEAIEKLVQQQKSQIDQLKAAKELLGLDDSMTTLRTNTLAVAEDAKESRAAVVIKNLNDAADHQGDASTAIRDAKREPAAGAERLSLASLESALQELKRLSEQAKVDQDNKERDQLKGEYTKLAKEQEAILKSSTELAGLEQPTRRQRADMIDLGNREADLQIAVNKLADRVKDTVMFAELHKQIDAAALRAVAGLRSARADDEVIDDETAVGSMLWTMAQALDDAQKQQSEFAKQSDGGGGGGGGGGGAAKLIPPAAQLKLLRGLQEAIYKQTKATAQKAVAAGAEERRARTLEKLSVQQRDLAGLGEQLIESLQRPTTAGPSKE